MHGEESERAADEMKEGKKEKEKKMERKKKEGRDSGLE